MKIWLTDDTDDHTLETEDLDAIGVPYICNFCYLTARATNYEPAEYEVCEEEIEVWHLLHNPDGTAILIGVCGDHETTHELDAKTVDDLMELLEAEKDVCHRFSKD